MNAESPEPAWYRDLFENAPVGLFRATPEGRLVDANPALVRALGYPDRAALLAAMDGSRVHFPHPAEPDRRADESVVVAQLGPRDPSAAGVQVNLRAVRDERGQLVYYAGALADSGEHRTGASISPDKDALLQALAEIGREIIAAHEPQGVLDLVCRRAAELTRAPKSLVIARLGDGESRLVAHYGIQQPQAAALEYARLAQTSAADAEPLNAGITRCDDIADLPARMPGLRADENLRAFAAAPLAVGALIVLDTQPHHWTPDQVQSLTLLANQTAVALNKLQLYDQAREHAEQMELLYDSGLALSRVLDPEEQLNILTTIAMRALRAERAEFARYDKMHNHVRIELNIGYHAAILPALKQLCFRLDDERGIIGQVGRNHAPLYVPDVFDDPNWIVVDPAIRSGVWAPVEHDAQLYGILGVMSTHPAAFNPQDERLLALFASQAGAALANAQLLEETRGRTLYLATLNEIGQAITSSLDLDRVLTTLLNTVRQATHAGTCSVALTDPDTSEMIYTQAVSREAQSDIVGQRLAFGQGIVGWVAEHRQTVLVSDATADPRFVRLANRRTDFVVRDLVCAPLIAGAHVIGVIELTNKSDGTFTPSDAELLESVATQAAVAIEHARLFQETRRRLSELQVVSEAALAGATGQTFDQAVARAAAGLGQLWPDVIVGLLFIGENDQTLHVHPATHNIPAHIASATQIPVGRGLTGWAAQTRQPLRVGNVTADPRYIPGIPNVLSEMVAPLVAGQRVIGVVDVESPRLNDFTDSDLRLLITVADQLATIFEKARLDAALETERATLARRVQERTAELSAANAELARAARAKDEFLASMSHELRTPLNAVLGLSEALQEQVYGAQNEKQLKALQSITESGRHLLDLINDILDLSKIEAGKLTLQLGPLQVEPICQASLRFIKETANQKRIQVAFKLDPDVKTMQADSRRLKQILVNLLSNAVKFTPPGGSVGLEVTGRPDTQAIRFTVWDTGIGIAPGDMPRLFQPFVQLDSRLDRQHTGTGLGLSLVSRMAELHGGGILVESEVGRGSRFTIALPWQTADSAPSAAEPAIAAGQLEGKLQRALIVDHSGASAEQMARYLADLNITPEIRSHGRGVLEHVVSSPPDVILLDALLADVSGWSVLAQLKAEPRARDIPTIITAITDERSRSLALGAAEGLVKPVTRQQLYAALHKVAMAQAAGARSEGASPPSAAQPLILLAEDSESNISTMSDYLRSKGFHVVVARNGVEAIERAREHTPDLILMDVQMPQMDGLEATRRIRAEPALAHVPILALTALAMPGDRERCLDAGVTDQLTKPVGLRDMVQAIQAHLAHRTREAI